MQLMGSSCIFELSYNDKEAAKVECTFARFNVTQFYVKCEINLMMTLEI